MRVDAVVLAGGRADAIDEGARFKGLASVAGRPMVEWVVGALREAETIGEIAVVVPSAEDLGPWADRVDKLVVSDGDVSVNVFAGAGAFGDDRPILLITGDLPMLTAAAVDDYVERSERAGADFTYAFITKERMLSEYPGGKRTFISLREGEMTGGNVVYANPALFERNRELGQRVFDARKSPVAMVRILGARFIGEFLRGRLSLSSVERRASELVGGSCAVFVTEHASIGMDVDKPEDVDVVERALRARGA